MATKIVAAWSAVISLGTCPITLNWSVKLFACNVCLAAISSGFWTWSGISLVEAYPFPLLLLEPLQQHLNHSRCLVLTIANTHPLCLVPNRPCMHDIPWWKNSPSATFLVCEQAHLWVMRSSDKEQSDLVERSLVKRCQEREPALISEIFSFLLRLSEVKYHWSKRGKTVNLFYLMRSD